LSVAFCPSNRAFSSPNSLAWRADVAGIYLSEIAGDERRFRVTDWSGTIGFSSHEISADD